MITSFVCFVFLYLFIGVAIYPDNQKSVEPSLMDSFVYLLVLIFFAFSWAPFIVYKVYTQRNQSVS